MDLKQLKKLADTCRKAGIKSYKDKDFEFTLSEEAPVSNYKKKSISSAPLIDNSNSAIESDGLSEEDMLFWSTGNIEVAPSEDNAS